MSTQFPTIDAPPPHRKWTVREFMQLAEMGMLPSRCELVHGEIVETPPQGNAHSLAVMKLHDALRAGFPPPWFMRVQMTHRFADDVAYEPAVCLLERDPAPDALVDDPAQLIVEVSESTLRYDLNQKRLDYARFSVPEYWVVDLRGRRARVFREPDRAATVPESAYRQEWLLAEGEDLSPLLKPSLKIRVSSILPPACI